jgi:hypothetical protein
MCAQTDSGDEGRFLMPWRRRTPAWMFLLAGAAIGALAAFVVIRMVNP